VRTMRDINHSSGKIADINAALVEEMAAAATSLNQQASELVGTVATFNLPQV